MDGDVDENNHKFSKWASMIGQSILARVSTVVTMGHLAISHNCNIWKQGESCGRRRHPSRYGGFHVREGGSQ